MRHEGLDEVDVPTIRQMKTARQYEADAAHELQLKEERELQKAKRLADRRKAQEERWSAVAARGSGNGCHRFSDQVPLEVLEYLEDLQADVATLAAGPGDDPRYNDKLPSLARRITWYKTNAGRMRAAMDGATPADLHLCCSPWGPPHTWTISAKNWPIFTMPSVVASAA